MDGNGFFIIARVTSAMKKAGLTSEQRQEYSTEAMAGDYNHLLQTTMRYVDCDGADFDDDDDDWDSDDDEDW